MVPSSVRRFIWYWHCALLVLLGALAAGSAPAGAAEAAEYWSVCTDETALSRQLGPIARRIEARLEAGRGVQVSAVPQGEGSTEYFLASMADLFAQLRSLLQARKAPLLRVSFQWLSLSDGASPPAVVAVACRGAVLLVEVATGER